MHLHHVTNLAVGLHHDAAARRGDGDRGLVGHDLDHRLVFFDDFAGLDEPRDDFAFCHALTDVR